MLSYQRLLSASTLLDDCEDPPPRVQGQQRPCLDHLHEIGIVPEFSKQSAKFGAKVVFLIYGSAIDRRGLRRWCSGLIIRWSLVRVQPGPPLTPLAAISYGRRSRQPFSRLSSSATELLYHSQPESPRLTYQPGVQRPTGMCSQHGIARLIVHCQWRKQPETRHGLGLRALPTRASMR